MKKEITYSDMYYEVKRIALLHSQSKIPQAKNCYEQYIKLSIDGVNLSDLEKEILLDLWGDLK